MKRKRRVNKEKEALRQLGGTELTNITEEIASVRAKLENRLNPVFPTPSSSTAESVLTIASILSPNVTTLLQQNKGLIAQNSTTLPDQANTLQGCIYKELPVNGFYCKEVDETTESIFDCKKETNESIRNRLGFVKALKNLMIDFKNRDIHNEFAKATKAFLKPVLEEEEALYNKLDCKKDEFLKDLETLPGNKYPCKLVGIVQDSLSSYEGEIGKQYREATQGRFLMGIRDFQNSQSPCSKLGEKARVLGNMQDEIFSAQKIKKDVETLVKNLSQKESAVQGVFPYVIKELSRYLNKLHKEKTHCSSTTNPSVVNIYLPGKTIEKIWSIIHEAEAEENFLESQKENITNRKIQAPSCTQEAICFSKQEMLRRDIATGVVSFISSLLAAGAGFFIGRRCAKNKNDPTNVENEAMLDNSHGAQSYAGSAN
ncbi:MAG: hypothetical protein V4700_00895 [Pseudomonadota bacterium]